MKACLIAVVLLFFHSSVLASGYAGIGVGKTDYDANEISSFDDPFGIELFAGYRSSENLGFEFAFVSFGEADDGIPPEWHLEADSLAFSLLGIAPVGAKSAVFLQLGFHMWDIELSEDGFGVFAEDDGNDLFFGFGFRGNARDNIDLGIRYINYDFGSDYDRDVTRLVLNVQFNFE